jgi:hypothetical protein
LAAAQSLDDYEFIHWQPGLPDPALSAVRLDEARVAVLRGAEAHVLEPATYIDVLFRGNGDIVQSVRSRIQFVDTAGIEQRGNTSVFVDSFAEELFVRQAAVLTPDGEAVGIEPDTLQVVVSDSGGVFSDVVELVVPWPRLTPGAIAAIDYEIVTKSLRLPVPWSRVFHPRSLTPRASYEISVRWESDVARPRVETDFTGLACADAGERQVLCTATDIEAVETDFDVNYVDEIPYAIVAENVTWNELARTVGGYVARSWTDEASVRRVVEEVTAGADGPEQKLRAIHTFVSKEIRYVGIETGTNGIVPRDTGLTLTRRFGDCKDKTALFLQMADIAGIDAIPVLVSSHRKNLEKLFVPSSDYFDHMVSCGVVGTTSFCVDLTDPHTGWDTYPPYLSGAVSLPLARDVQLPAPVPTAEYAWTMAVTSDNRFEGGSLVEHEKREYGPRYSGALRGTLDALSTDDLTAWAVDGYQTTSATDAEPKFAFSGLRQQHERLVIESDVTFPNVIATDDIVNYTHIPGWLRDLVTSFETKNEHYAYRFAGLLYRDTTTFRIGQSRMRTLGAELALEHEFGKMRRSYREKDGTVTIETLVEVPSRIVAVEQIAPFNAFLDVIYDQASANFRFDPGPAP